MINDTSWGNIMQNLKFALEILLGRDARMDNSRIRIDSTQNVSPTVLFYSRAPNPLNRFQIVKFACLSPPSASSHTNGN